MFDSLSDRISKDEGLKPAQRVARLAGVAAVSVGIFVALYLVLAFFE